MKTLATLLLMALSISSYGQSERLNDRAEIFNKFKKVTSALFEKRHLKSAPQFQLDSMVRQYINTTSQELEPSRRMKYKTFKDGHIEAEYSSWDDQMNSYRMSSTQSYFFEVGQLKLHEVYCDGTDLCYKYEADFDANNKIVREETWRNESGGELALSRVTTYSYDSKGKIDTIRNFSVDDVTQQEKLVEYLCLYYGSAGLLDSMIVWDMGDSDMEKTLKLGVENGVKQSWEIAFFDGSSNTYLPAEYKIECQFDANLDLVESIYYYWDDNSSSWEIDFKEDFAYDGASMAGDVYAVPLSYEHGSEKWEYWTYQTSSRALTTINEGLIDNSGNYVEGNRYEFYYSDFKPIGLKESVKDVVSVYPNPVASILNIEGDVREASIYDCLGNLMIHKKSDQMISQVDMSKLVSGVYFLVAEQEGGRVTRKIIKQ